MIAIETKYIGPTDNKPSRIRAITCNGQQLIQSYDHGLNCQDAHRKCAEALCDKMGWKGHLIGGGTREGYVFVFTE